MANKRICFIVLAFPPEYSGATLHALEFSKFLRQENIHSVFFSHTSRTDVLGWRTFEDNEVFRFKNKSFEKNHLLNYHLGLFLHLFRWRKRFDIIYLNGVWGQFWTSFYTILFGNILKKRVFIELNMEWQSDPLCITGTSFLRLKVWMAKKVTRFISLSSAMTESFRKHSFPDDLLTYSPKAVNIQRFKPVDEEQKMKLRRKLRIPEDKRVIVTVGPVIKRKGIDFLMAVAKEVVTKMGELHLWVVGPLRGLGVDERYVEEIMEIADSLPFNSQVKFLGKVDNVHEWLQASDVFVFAGRQEGSPNAIREPMACGLPVVALNLQGCTSDMIEHGKDGVLITPDNGQKFRDYHNFTLRNDACKQEFADWVVKILNDHGLAREIGDSAREKMVRKFSMETRAKKYAEMFSG